MLTLLMTLGTAQAADLTPTFDGRVSLAYWRLGTQLNLRPGVVMPMPWADPDSVLLAPAALKVEAEVAATPAFVRAGGRATWTPFAMLDVTPYAYFDQYFGNFQTVVGYEGWDENYGTNDDIEAYVFANDAQSTGRGYHYGAAATLKAKVGAGPGDVIVLLNGDWSRWMVNSPDLTDRYDYWFEREMEVMMRFGDSGGDNLVQGNGILMYELDRNPDNGSLLRFGNLTSYRMTTVADDHLFRTGALVQIPTYDGKWTHTVISQVYLKDRTYTKALPPFTAYQLKFVI
jgi:hypothetical protein